MKAKKIVGLTVAAAAALAFATVPATSALANKHQAEVKCMGINGCKGKSACATAQNACKGKNSCKGKGFMMMKSKQACEKKGGKVEEPAKS